MAARPNDGKSDAVIKTYTVSATVRKGFAVMVSAVATDGNISTIAEAGDADDIAIGIALEAGNTTTATRIKVALFGKGVVPALVGTGGCTAGLRAGWVADGATNIDFQVASGSTWTPACVYGTWLQTSVAADLADLNLGTGGVPGYIRST
jgi:hypothetical protein